MGLEIASSIGIAVLLMFKSEYLSKYLGKKGENKATKEDIKEITKEVESAKKQFRTDMQILTKSLEKENISYQIKYSGIIDRQIAKSFIKDTIWK